MKTFKKLFSVSAIVALLGTLAPMYAFGATYSTEMVQAYDYAHQKGITTMSSIDNADMNGNLTRIALAKMISKYAMEVKGLTPDTTKDCTFPDVSAALDEQYNNGVTLACQLGLMGQGIEKFNPNGIVTRAEFGTTFSRVLNADDADKLAEMNAADPYYKEHLNFLKEEGIMNNISDPAMKEVRGYVMIMMMRSDEGYTPITGCDATEIMNCLLLEGDAYDACIAACSEENPEEEPEVVKAGTLTVSVDDRSSEVVAAPRQGTITMNTINLKASEEITVDTLTLKTAGLTNKSAVSKVWFEKDGVRISSKASITSDGTATVNFTKGLTVKSNEKVDLVASFNSSTGGSQVTLELDSVNSTAEKNNISGKTTTYNLIDYTVAGLKYTIVNFTTLATYKLGEQNEILFTKVDLENDSNDKSINLKSITFNTNNANVEKVLNNFTLIRDGKNVAKSVTFDGKKVTVAVNDSIESSKKATYSLYAEVKALDNGSESFYLGFDADDIVAYEEGNTFRTTNTKNGGVVPACTTQNCVKIEGGKIVLSNDSSFATTVNANAGYSDVQIAQGTLTVAEPVHFEKLVFNDDGIAATQNDVKSLKLEIGGKTYNAAITRGAPNTYTFEDIYVNKTSSVKLYASFANTVNFSTLNIAGNNIVQGMFVDQAGNNTNVGDYQNNSVSFDNNDIAGSIKVATVSKKDTKFTLKNNLSSTVKAVVGDSNSVVLFDGNITSTKGDVDMTEITIAGVNMTTDYADLTLKVNGKTISTKKYTTAAITFPINNTKVTSEPVSIVLEAIPHTAIANKTYTFTVAAAGTFNGNTATANAVNAAPLQIVGSSSLVISSIKQPNQVKLEGNDVEIMTFDVTAQYGNVNLSEFKVVTDTAGLTPSLDIDDGTTVVLTAACTTDGANSTACVAADSAAVAKTPAYASAAACTTAKPANTATWSFTCNGSDELVATQITPAELALGAITIEGIDFTVTTAGHAQGVWGKAYIATGIDETLNDGKHTFVVKSNIRAAEGSDAGVNVNTTKVFVNGTEKAMATNTLFVKVMPEVTLVSKADNVMTISVKNTTKTPVTLTKLNTAKTATTATVVINGQDVAVGNTAITAITLGENEEATIEMTVGATGLLKLQGFSYYVEDGAYQYTYDITSTYTTYPWGTFQVTYK